MGWRDTLSVDAQKHLGDIIEVPTIHTKPPVKGESDPKAPSSVCIVPGFIIPDKSGDDVQAPLIASNHLQQFYVGQTVSYRIPIVTHATSYFWESRTGTIEAIDIHNERLTIIPESEEQPLKIVSWCYCQPKAPPDEN